MPVLKSRGNVVHELSPGKPIRFEKIGKRWHIVVFVKGNREELKIPVRHIVEIAKKTLDSRT